MDKEGNNSARTAPIICKTKVLGDGMFAHGSALETRWRPRWRDTPMISPFLGAGIIFSRGHRIRNVPYDCCLPMMFAGEEMSVGSRAWTSGYDLYAPVFSFVQHPYG